MSADLNDILGEYFIQPNWISKNNINPNLYLYYDKLYIIKLSKPSKIFIGSLVSIDDNICNFINPNNDDILSLIFENNDELSSMIIIPDYNKKDVGYTIDEIFIVDEYNPEKSDYSEYQEIDFVEEIVKKKNYTKTILEDDLLSFFIKEFDYYDNDIKINSIRSLVDQLYILIHTKSTDQLNYFDWLEKPISNLLSKSFIPLIDNTINFVQIDIEDDSTNPLSDFLQTCDDISTKKYNDVMKIYDTWLNRYTPNSTPIINEYNGLGYLSNDTIDQLQIYNEDISLSSLIEIPIDKILYNENYSLLEKILCDNIFYNNIRNINNYKTYPITKNTWPEILDDLKKYINSLEQFTDVLLSHNIMNYIINYKDLSYILNKYNLSFDKFSKNDRKKISSKIEENCKLYIKKCPKIYIKSKYKKRHLIDNSKKLDLAKNYIFSQIFNNDTKILLERFINIYTRNSDKVTESNLWYYNIITDQPILCKHYEYLIKSNNDNSIFDTMINRFGTDPVDGCIFCKNCGEFLCLEEFSTLSGFKDDEPTTQVAVLSEKNNDFDIINDPINDKIIELLNFFSEIFNIPIDDQFKVNTIDIYLYIDSKLLSSIRYNNNDISLKPIHPRIKKDIDDINTQISSTKKKSEKKLLEEDKKDIFESFQLWLHNTNRFISILIIFIILNQTNSLTHKRNVDLLDVNTRDINPKYLLYIKTKIFRSFKNIDDKRLDYLIYLASDEELSCNNFETQLSNSINYIKNISVILEKYDNYKLLKNTQQHNYIREEWNLYKPLYNNILVQDVRNLINNNLQTEYLLKKYGNYKVQNISLIRPITQNTTIADLCKIPKLEIIQNSAFIQFFRLCISCYGIHPPNPYINLLVSQIINELENPEIPKIFSKYGFKNGGFKDLNFHKFRNKLIPDILKSYPNQFDNNIIHSCFDDEESCNELIHISINTYDLHLLNTYPKRYYYYNPLKVFPDMTFEQYNQYNKENPDDLYTLLPNLFNHYAINSIGDYVTYTHLTYPIQNKILTDTKSITKTIPHNSDNFELLLSLKTIFTQYPTYIYPPLINRLNNSLTPLLDLNINSKDNIRYLKDVLDKLLADANDKYINQQMKASFSDLINTINETISKISKFIITSRWITNEQLSKFKKLMNLDFTEENITKFLMLFIMDREYTSEYIKLDIQHIKYIFINIISNHPYDIPKEWKLTTSEDNFSSSWFIKSDDDDQFIKTELLLHDRIFLSGSRDNYPGFNQYMNSKHISLLFNYISDIFNNLECYKGNDINYYNTMYSNIFYKNILIEIIYLIINYIDKLSNSISDISTDANELFLQLNISEEEFKQEGIDICSRLLMDIINDLLLSHYDPNWIYQNKTKNDLNKRLSKQREREKLLHLSRLTDVTKDQRFIADQKQKIGLSNMWKQGAIDCQNFVNSSEAATLNASERTEKLKEILEDNGVTSDDFQMVNLTNQLTNDEYEHNEGYEYNEDFDEDDDPDQGLYDEEQEPVNNI